MRNRAARRRQQGLALLALAAILVLGMSWLAISSLGNASQRTVLDRGSNARALAEAKAALIGWIAANALDNTERNPGHLPCPQAWANVNDTSNDGVAAGNCAAPAAGLLPWRTLGISKLLDSAGNQLWYIVSPGWHVPSSTALLTINSETPGQLTLNGQAVVALLIAPGPALRIQPNANQTAAGCTARVQSQTMAGLPTALNPLDFLDCHNGTTADNTFVTGVVDNAINPVFNDQVVAVTAADIMPALEAAIAKRIEREIVPALKDVYLGPAWGLATGARVFPYAAPFGDPGPGAGTSTYAGAAATYQGLLPFNQVNCTASAANPRCLPGAALTSWATTPTAYDAGGWGYIQTQSCWWEPGNAARVCEGEYHESTGNESMPGMRIEMQATLNNIAMGLRAFDATRMQVQAKDDSTTVWEDVTVNHVVTMSNDGSVTIRFWGDLPNIDSKSWGTYANYRIRIERLVVTDHALLDATTTGAGSTGWFARNEWFRLLYYAAAQNHTANNLPTAPSCTTNVNCLRLTTWPSAAVAWDKRALLILAGAALTGQTRPSTAPANYVEFGNNDGGTLYEQGAIRRGVNAALKAPFNDRVIVVDANP